MSDGAAGTPFFSVCVPQYRRVPFLMLALESLRAQTMRDFEVCISDDCSPEAEAAELRRYLESSSLRFRHRMQKVNRRYDGNLRTAIHMARGRYVFLLANDDRLESPGTLHELRLRIQNSNYPALVLTNFRDSTTGAPSVRIHNDEARGGGLTSALWVYHRTSFVSGIVLDRSAAFRERTRRVDGSEMYQMYLAARIVAKGGHVLATTQVAIEKDLQIPGEAVDSYARKAWQGLNAPLARYPETACLALHEAPWGAVPSNFRVLARFLSLTMPFWILEYRRLFGATAGRDVFHALAPARLSSRLRVPLVQRAALAVLHSSAGLFARAVPPGALRLGPRIWALTKKLA